MNFFTMRFGNLSFKYLIILSLHICIFCNYYLNQYCNFFDTNEQPDIGTKFEIMY